MASINTVMPRISRHRDRCKTGHKCSVTAPVNARQYSVFANGKAILIRGDKVAPHTIPRKKKPKKCIPHKARMTGSSFTVFVRNIGVGRKGDKADMGSMRGASFDVYAG